MTAGCLSHDPLGRFPGQERRVVPPGRIGGLMPLGPVGAKQQYAPGLDRDPLLRQRRLRPLHVLRGDARPGLAAERQVQHHRRAHQRLQRKLLHRRHVPEEMVRRIDVGARVNGHLHKVGDEPLLFPVDDGLDLEVGLVGSERSRIALLYGHAEIDDAHGKGFLSARQTDRVLISLHGGGKSTRRNREGPPRPDGLYRTSPRR